MSTIYESPGWGTAKASSPLIPEIPFASDPTPYVWRQTFTQALDEWEPMERGERHANGAYLVGESNPSHFGGGMVEWERVWAKVPKRRVEAEGSVFTLERVEGNQILRNTRPTTCELWYDYFYAPGDKAFQIPLYSAERIVRLNDEFVKLGGAIFTRAGITPPPSLISPIPLFETNSQVRVVVEDSILTRWMGDIYERLTKTVCTYVTQGVVVE